MERLQEWSMRNTLFLFSSVVLVSLYLWMVNWVCDSLLPTLEGSGAQEIKFGSNSVLAILAKLVGSVVIQYLLHKQSTKR